MELYVFEVNTMSERAFSDSIECVSKPVQSRRNVCSDEASQFICEASSNR